MSSPLTITGVTSSASVSDNQTVNLFGDIVLGDPAHSSSPSSAPDSVTFAVDNTAALAFAESGTFSDVTVVSNPNGITLTSSSLQDLQTAANKVTATTAPEVSGTKTLANIQVTLSNPNTGSTVSANEALTVNGYTLPLAGTLSGPTMENGAIAGTPFHPFDGLVVSGSGDTSDLISMVVKNTDALGAFTPPGTGFDTSSLPYAYTVAQDGSILFTNLTVAQVQANLKALAYTVGNAASGQPQPTTAGFTVSDTVNGASDPNNNQYTVSVYLNGTAPNPLLALNVESSLATQVASNQEVGLFPNLQLTYSGASSTTLTATVTANQTDGSYDFNALRNLTGVTFELDNSGTVATITAPASTMLQALQALRFGVGNDGSYTADTFGVSITDGNTGHASFTKQVNVIPPWSVDSTGKQFSVGGSVGEQATINAASTQNAIIFGGNADLTATIGQGTQVVMNGSGVGNASIEMQGSGNTIWTGQQSHVVVTGQGGSVIAMGATAGQSADVTLSTAANGAGNDVWLFSTGGATQTVTNTTGAETTLFGGGSDLNYSGANGDIVLNSASVTGATTVNSTGGNTIWAGGSQVTDNENGGNNVVALSQTTNVAINGSSTASGAFTLYDFGGSSNVLVTGGAETDNISVTGSHVTVFGGSGSQNLSLNGSGSLVVVDGASSSGQQTVSAGAGSLQFWGGANAATINAGSGNAYLKVGTGDTTVNAGSGSMTVDLSAAAHDVLNIGGNSGNIDVFGFNPSTTALSVADVVQKTVSAGSSVMLLANGHTVTLHGYLGN